MKIILTGATGFLGTAICNQFKDEELITIGRKNGDIIAHLEQSIPDLPFSDLVIHAAGKAHSVPKTTAQEQAFYETNVKGTANLLNAIAKLPHLPKAFVFISSIAVYGVEEGLSLDESTALQASDAYGKSKIEAEGLVIDWCEKQQVKCAILRLPLIAGTHPPGNLGAMIKGIKKGYYFNIAGGKARKSMVMREDIAAIILTAAQQGGIYHLTDGHHPSFFELSGTLSRQMGKATPMNIPYWLAQVLAFAGDLIGSKAPINSKKLKKVTKSLTFADDKAKLELGWNPKSVISQLKL